MATFISHTRYICPTSISHTRYICPTFISHNRFLNVVLTSIMRQISETQAAVLSSLKGMIYHTGRELSQFSHGHLLQSSIQHQHQLEFSSWYIRYLHTPFSVQFIATRDLPDQMPIFISDTQSTQTCNNAFADRKCTQINDIQICDNSCMNDPLRGRVLWRIFVLGLGEDTPSL